MSKINFFKEDAQLRISELRNHKKWLTSTVQKEGHKISEINYIFCSDEYLLQINKEFLNHDYYTDIITFDNSTEIGLIQADIFISVDRVIENAKKEGTSFPDELSRVMIHGILHLCGYKDKSSRDKLVMREKEDLYLSLRDNN